MRLDFGSEAMVKVPVTLSAENFGRTLFSRTS